ncbi:MAG TPA: tetratricopeptide repeat protein [Streptosporangiaceae bacterium]|nr:tetratricopeptide repeat protein [Streptosporangiaceae bacterium]
MTLESIPPGPEPENLFGGWLEIAATVGRFVSQLPGPGGVSAVVNMLAALADAQDGRTALLRSIKADTAVMRIAPLKHGLRSLQEARRVGPTNPLWDTFIRRAEDSLSEALERVSGPQEEALVELNLGVVYLAMGHRDSARHHLEHSVQCADRAVDEYVGRSGSAIGDFRTPPAERRPTGFNGRNVATIAAILGTVTITNGILSPSGFYLDAMTPWGRRACRDLERFIGFYNLIQRTASSVSGAQPQYLVLSGPEEPLVKGLFRKQPNYPLVDYPYVLYTSSR